VGKGMGEGREEKSREKGRGPKIRLSLGPHYLLIRLWAGYCHVKVSEMRQYDVICDS
jgi:hypothetical protein